MLKNQVIVEHYLPYSELLPKIDIMLNSGYGGVSQALYNNTKLICTGDSEDKAEIYVRVEYAGVGINLKTND